MQNPSTGVPLRVPQWHLRSQRPTPPSTRQAGRRAAHLVPQTMADPYLTPHPPTHDGGLRGFHAEAELQKSGKEPEEDLASGWGRAQYHTQTHRHSRLPVSPYNLQTLRFQTGAVGTDPRCHIGCSPEQGKSLVGVWQDSLPGRHVGQGPCSATPPPCPLHAVHSHPPRRAQPWAGHTKGPRGLAPG